MTHLWVCVAPYPLRQEIGQVFVPCWNMGLGSSEGGGGLGSGEVLNHVELLLRTTI